MRHNFAPDSLLFISFIFKIGRSVWSVFTTLKDKWLIWKLIFIQRNLFKFHETLNQSISLIPYWIYYLRKLSEALKLSNYNNLTKSKKFNCAFPSESSTVKAALVNQLLNFYLHFDCG